MLFLRLGTAHLLRTAPLLIFSFDSTRKKLGSNDALLQRSLLIRRLTIQTSHSLVQLLDIPIILLLICVSITVGVLAKVVTLGMQAVVINQQVLSIHLDHHILYRVPPMVIDRLLIFLLPLQQLLHIVPWNFEFLNPEFDATVVEDLAIGGKNARIEITVVLSELVSPRHYPCITHLLLMIILIFHLKCLH
jgi:hypothetical protein